MGTALTSQHGIIVLGFSMIAISVGSLRLIGPLYIGDFASLEAAAINLRALYSTAFLVYAGLYWLRTIQRIPYWTGDVDTIDPKVPRRFGGYLLVPAGIYVLTQRLIVPDDVFNTGPPEIFAIISTLLSVFGLLYLGWSLLLQQDSFCSRLIKMYQPNVIETEIKTVTVAFTVYYSSIVIADGLFSLFRYSAILLAGGIIYLGIKYQRTPRDWMTRTIAGSTVVVLGVVGALLPNIVGTAPIGDNTPLHSVIVLLVGQSLFFHSPDLIYWGVGYLLFLGIHRSSRFEIGR